MPGVLILDANQRSALAATRSLGRRGVRVVVGDETSSSLAGSSRFAAKHVVYPSPYTSSEAFVEALQALVDREAVDVVLPMTDVTTSIVCRYRAELHGFKSALPPWNGFQMLSDKWTLAQVAADLGLRTPKTHLVTDRGATERFCSDVGFPVVVKPRHSRLEHDGQWIRQPVEYARDPDSLRLILDRRLALPAETTLLQQAVRGQGQGVFTLFREGRTLGFFAHRRLRERPPSGGVSVLCESVPVDPTLREAADRLLREARWHGVAMVEFKVTEQGEPFLIEVNGRFWGSLQLAIDAGIDFPYLVYQMAVGEAVDSLNSYITGVRSRWLLGDLDTLYLSLFRSSTVHPTARSRLDAISAFLRTGGRHTRHDVNRFDDLGPFLYELRSYMHGQGR